MTTETLSLAALGLLLRLQSHGENLFNLEHAQQAEAGGMGKDRALGLLAELKRAGCIHRTRGGYKLAGSSPEPINNSGKHRSSGFQELSTTYLYRSSNQDQGSVVQVSESTENTDFPEVQVQAPLPGCSDAPTPVPPPPSPAKPKRPRNPPAPPEIKALYEPLFTLTKSPRKGEAAMGVYTKARDLWHEFEATPEQVSAFWGWFKTFSVAAQQAARERRPVNPPKPRQVYADWPQFLEWHEATRKAAARAAAERERARAVETAPPSSGERLSGAELYRRTFATFTRPPQPPTALTAD